ALSVRRRQDRRVFRAFFHLAQNEIACPVENAFNAFDPVARQSLLKTGNHWYSTRNGSAIFEVTAMDRGQALQFYSVKGDQLLVGGDHALPCFVRPAHPTSGRIKTACQ